MNEELVLIKRLDALRDRHRELDERIQNVNPRNDAFMYMRLKKEKLCLRDEIARIEAVLYPDIVA